MKTILIKSNGTIINEMTALVFAESEGDETYFAFTDGKLDVETMISDFNFNNKCGNRAYLIAEVQS